jgi:hypothetical protein
MPMAPTGKDLAAGRRPSSSAGDRFPWWQYRRLLWNETTLSRVLSEIELESLCDMKMSGVERRVLVAGGGAGPSVARNMSPSPGGSPTCRPCSPMCCRPAHPTSWPTSRTRGPSGTMRLMSFCRRGWSSICPIPPPTFTKRFGSCGVLVSTCAPSRLYRQHGSPQDFVRLTGDAPRSSGLHGRLSPHPGPSGWWHPVGVLRLFVVADPGTA